MNEIDGKSFAFTGVLEFPRRELRAALEERGGIYHARLTCSDKNSLKGNPH